MEITEELLKEFWKDANSYQSIDVGMFDIDEYVEEWIERHRNQVKNNGVLDYVMCDCEDKNYSVPEMNRKKCFQCKNKIDCI